MKELRYCSELSDAQWCSPRELYKDHVHGRDNEGVLIPKCEKDSCFFTKFEFFEPLMDVNIIPCAPVYKSKTLKFSFLVASSAVLVVIDTVAAWLMHFEFWMQPVYCT